ncbi:MAG: hypothetical protein M1371_06790 [Actinobacteria bacterium]|nr:hypothetical protein [Actinomycetota bacterium]
MLERNLIDDPFRELGRLALHYSRLRWGWAILLVGAIIIIAASISKNAVAHSSAHAPKQIV